jgi:hypothetical protein
MKVAFRFPFRVQRMLAILSVLSFAIDVSAATEKILHSFNAYPSGSQPAGTPIADAAGNFYGTTCYGGARQLARFLN